jgi:hypothetical protein
VSSEHNPYSAPGAYVDDAGKKPKGSPSAVPDGPRGIGGWLILPLLGLILTPIRVGFSSVRDLAPALKPGTWAALTTPGAAAYHPLWAPVLVFECVVNGLLIVCSLVLLWLFLRKSHRVPLLMVAWLVAIVAVQVVDLLLVGQIPAAAAAPDAQGIRDLVRLVLSALIWIPYFLRSKRVKNTFVERA